MLSGCNGEEAERKRLELQRAVDTLQFEARPGRILPLAISVGAAVFPHDGDTYETLLATADSRMYRDKTRRKRSSPSSPDRNGDGDHGEPTVKPTAPTASLSETDLKRAATGIL